MQKLCGFLNFLCKCIVPRHAFTRCLYTNFNTKMMPHHHINVNLEMRKYLETWKTFLLDPSVYCRPFLDFTTVLTAEYIDWFTDASGTIGYGRIFNNHWFAAEWEKQFLKEMKLSIEFQELFGVTVSILLWGENFRNRPNLPLLR